MTVSAITAILIPEIPVRHHPTYLRSMREARFESGERIIWLAQLSGRGDHLFPVAGVVVSVAGRTVTIAVEAFGGKTVRRVVHPNRVLPWPD
jgi:hypothetical protein